MAVKLLVLENYSKVTDLVGMTSCLFNSTMSQSQFVTNVDILTLNNKRWISAKASATFSLTVKKPFAAVPGDAQVIGFRVMPKATTVNPCGIPVVCVVDREFYFELAGGNGISPLYRVDAGPWLAATGYNGSGGNHYTSLSGTAGVNSYYITDVYVLEGLAADALGPINVNDAELELVSNTNWVATNLAAVIAGDRGNQLSVNANDIEGKLKLKLKALPAAALAQQMVGLQIGLKRTHVPGYPAAMDFTLDRTGGNIETQHLDIVRSSSLATVGLTFTGSHADLKTPQTLLDDISMTFTAKEQ
jgi:hypothetical protein